MNSDIIKKQLIEICLKKSPENIARLLELWNNVGFLVNLSAAEIKILTMLLPELPDQTTKHSLELEVLQLNYRKKLHEFRATSLRLQQNLGDVLRVFNRLNVSPILLKGAALLERWPQQFENRVMTDIDLLIPYSMRLEVMDSLTKRGWRNISNHGAYFTEWTHAFSMLTPNHLNVDVHWHLMPKIMALSFTEKLFQNSKLVSASGFSYLKMDLTHLFLHLCAHGIQKKSSDNLQWILDVFNLLKEEPHLNWEELFGVACEAHLSQEMSAALSELVHYGLEIPDWVIQGFKNYPVSKIEILEFKKNTEKEIRFREKTMTGIFSEFLNWFFIWRARFRSKGIKMKPTDFLRYYGRSESLWKVVKMGPKLFIDWLKLKSTSRI